MSKIKLLAVLAAALLAAGCPSTSSIPDPEPETTTAGGADDAGATTSGGDFEDWEDGTSVDFEDPTGDELAKIIFFEFDSSEVRAEDTDTVSRHAMLLVPPHHDELLTNSSRFDRRLQLLRRRHRASVN